MFIFFILHPHSCLTSYINMYIYSFFIFIFWGRFDFHFEADLTWWTIDPMAANQIRQFLPYLISFISFVELSNI